MKRKALMTLAEVGENTFDLWQKRGHLPFVTEGGRWTEYDLGNALALRLMSNLAKLTDLRTASDIASGAVDLRPSPFWPTGEDMYLCAAIYEYPDGDSMIREIATWGARENEALTGRPAYVLADYREIGFLAVNASAAAREILTGARELGMPEAVAATAVPQDLSGLPDWFVTHETARRAVLSEGNA